MTRIYTLVLLALNKGAVIFLPGTKCRCWLFAGNQRLRGCEWTITNNKQLLRNFIPGALASAVAPKPLLFSSND
ncbi:MAG: hypothetical protein KDD04_08415 [Sinomicrobium sp.]|nr:hypothetical protein [Sinomicrobium sp.]